jgi:hypothetical protein
MSITVLKPNVKENLHLWRKNSNYLVRVFAWNTIGQKPQTSGYRFSRVMKRKFILFGLPFRGDKKVSPPDKGFTLKGFTLKGI